MKSRTLLVSIGGGGLGALIAHALSGFFLFTARVAAKIRPGLADLTFWEALWSNHFWEWCWLNYSTLCKTITILVFASIGFILTYYILR